jgi:Permuted papain-like amidase enzyme, YaeF/YiiX, C92 family
LKNRTIAILISLVAVTVLLFASTSVVSAASGGRERVRQLSTKERLTADDVQCLKSLPRGERKDILVARGWQEIVIPDRYENYRDLVPVEELTVAYQEVLKISGNEVAKNEFLTESGQMRSLDQTLKAIEQSCMDKEDCIPFDEFKTEERWMPSAEDLRRNHDTVGGWGMSPGDGNSCDFGQSVNGDFVLVKGSGLFPGVFCHAAIVKYQGSSALFSIGPDGENGVWWNSRSLLHQYSHASVQRVDTWPLSSNRRQDAADYARKQLGKPYNWIFVDKWRTDAFYCSQLCWAAYYHPSPWYYKLDVDGVMDILDYGAVAPDALWASWRTGTATCSD